jgi:hypothetical protein
MLQPQLAAIESDAEAFIRTQSFSDLLSRTTSSSAAVIRIPVVVHILHNGVSDSVSDAQVRSQLEVLNRDFNKRNTDTNKIPSAFKQRAANTQIEFVLAVSDPNGRPTNGILRKKTPVSQWYADDKIKFRSQGGSDAWDSRYYLNIWVGHLYRLLGYASVPGSDPSRDGIVLNTTAFGTIGVGAPFHLGRTAVHEVGHWLGLKHIWGDDYCGDDFVQDTPPQGGFTTGCPGGYRSSCDNAATGDMYMNYMDFTDDACILMFTEGQKNRMRALFHDGGHRYSLLMSKGLDAPWNFTPQEEEKPAPPEFSDDITFYPNPVVHEIRLKFDNMDIWSGRQLQITNIQGVVIKSIQIVQPQQVISLNELRPGIYFISAQTDGKQVRKKLVKI